MHLYQPAERRVKQAIKRQDKKVYEQAAEVVVWLGLS